MFQELIRKSGEHFQNLWWRGAEKETNCPQSTSNDAKNCEVEEDSQNSSKKQWCELNEVVDSDFLISPGDIYPCKVYIHPVAHVGSGDPVRVLRLYTTITLDEVCSIYC